MKLQFRDIDHFLKSLDPKMRAVLIYGPDGGLVQERSALLGKQVVTDLNDPFNTAHLTGETVAADPARLGDEAEARSLMGGKRMVRITAAGNELAVPLKAWLKGNPNPDCVVLIEAGNLGPRDALRKLCEDAPNAAALPCYIEDEKGLGQLIREQLKTEGFTAQPDAVSWLAASIKGDRLRARMEIEKLIVYMGPGGGPKTVTLEDAQASCGDAGVQTLDDFVYAFGSRSPRQSLEAMTKLLGEGVALIALIRPLQNHLLRLHGVKVLVENGSSDLDAAMKALQPPVFFKQADQFKAQLRSYSSARLRELLRELNDLEARTKQSGVPAETLLGDFLLRAA